MRLTLQQLETGLNALAEEVRRPRDLLLDLQKQKRDRLDRYWSEIHKIEFSEGSIGRFSPGRGRPIQRGDRFGFATGTTRRETTRSFTLETEGDGMVLTMGPTNSWAKYFNITLLRRDIPEFKDGILPLTAEDQRDAEELAGRFIVEVTEEAL